MTTATFSKLASATAQAMAQVQAHRKPGDDVTGRIQCPKCGSALRFTVLCNGLSRGQCAAPGCIRWLQ